MRAVVIATGVFLICAGVVNLTVGFMALFPGLFEAGVSNSMPSDEKLLALIGTQYGAYALALLGGAAAQMLGGSYLAVLLQIERIAAPLLAALAVLCLGLEAWAFLFKGYATLLAIPGVVSGAMCLYLIKFRQRHAADLSSSANSELARASRRALSSDADPRP